MAARILIVEDEAIVAQNLRETLVHYGYEVAGVAATSEQALALAAADRPDLILMDIRLIGQGNGVETAERLKSVHAAPVVYVTAFSADVTLERAVGTAPYGFLQKPVSDKALRATIAMALERRRLETALQESEARLRELSESLERKVAERTRALERNLAVLAAFSARLAHDIRSPIGVVGSMSYLLRIDEAANLSEAGRRTLATIEDNIGQLAGLVDELIAHAEKSREALERPFQQTEGGVALEHRHPPQGSPERQ